MVVIEVEFLVDGAIMEVDDGTVDVVEEGLRLNLNILLKKVMTSFQILPSMDNVMWLLFWCV